MVTCTKQAKRWNDVLSASCVILIVDDAEADRVAYRRYLESANSLDCSIFDCESAAEALQFCGRYCPDVILLDYLLPDVDGLELLQDLTQQLGTTSPPIIMLTGQGSESVAVAAMKHGARDYLIKGELTPQKLINSVTNVLTEQKLRAQIDRQRQQQELLTSIALKISYSIELSQILPAAVEGVRELLGCDRAIVYRLAPDMVGTIVAESVLPEWPAAIDCQVEDNCFQGEHSYQIGKYLQGYRMVISDIESANLTECHMQMLQQFQVKAVLVVPILFRDVSPSSELLVWGLLIAHHCETVHEWKADEINLLDEISMQMAIAIQQSELLSDLQAIVEKHQATEQQLRDRVAEVQRTNVHLFQASRLLEKRNQELDEFSYIASHDLQAPLRGIANLTEWLSKDLEGKLPAENQQQLELIQARVLQMNTLINGLLQYAQVGRENIDSRPVNISHLLAEVVEMLMPPAEFQIQFPADLPTIETSALLLKQVFSNLIGNAIKYHDRTDGKVEILVKDLDNFLQFTVIDDGLGIAPEHQKKVFGLFQTLGGPGESQGTGIGLAIIKKIVDHQGGSVWVESEVGNGSAFSFTWPKTPFDLSQLA
jgi:signal transduction histidine kinase/CheY-like chemotaxis protein